MRYRKGGVFKPNNIFESLRHKSADSAVPFGILFRTVSLRQFGAPTDEKSRQCFQHRLRTPGGGGHPQFLFKLPDMPGRVARNDALTLQGTNTQVLISVTMRGTGLNMPRKPATGFACNGTVEGQIEPFISRPFFTEQHQRGCLATPGSGHHLETACGALGQNCQLLGCTCTHSPYSSLRTNAGAL
ncbi:hypothetical protein ATPR_1427 [Acetobacter tropicalis NBRC 101654]|uniref:Uncharacterized protein n=1 Tax=Acetobacter tropicalis NBRC 101654 TaxID=749388 RepID=F7VDH8_9PROT|nr:hypothetical protein ATPR_1427 [Acetobacter tropicalis NBRC 101654]